jgi:hypothetical protein
LKIDTARLLRIARGESPDLPKAAIFDMDGTLASVKHREHYVTQKPKNWSMFHGHMVNDRPIEPTADVARRLSGEGTKIIVVTLRPERFRKETEEWLTKHDIPFDEAYFRPEGNYDPGDIVKRDIYETQIKPRFDVVASFDDNPKMQRMWQDATGNGVPVEDPGVPPYEGPPAPDPKYPEGRHEVGERPKSKWDRDDHEVFDANVSVYEPSAKVARGRTYVEPHVRNFDGQLVKVDGYWRELTRKEIEAGGAVVRLARKI